MPYTPPSARSPAASRPTTPRSESFQKQHPPSSPSHGSRQNLPHSASSQSYLSRHRRSPSISDTATGPFGKFATDTTLIKPSQTDSDDEPSQKSTAKSGTPEVSFATTHSPAHSPSQSSSDEEPNRQRRPGRDVADLAELQAAIRIIEQHRSGSPDVNASEETKKARSVLGLPGPRIEMPLMPNGTLSNMDHHRPLSEAARKISHSRSSTDASAFIDFPRNKFDSPPAATPSMTGSDDDENSDDDDLPVKPSLIRKKSGELVRPALRASSTRPRPSSMPGTPTYSKAVHFQDNSLEHVRHFLQVDRPIAVSAGTSPVDNSYEDDDSFPFSVPYDWEIRLTNFPRDPLGQLTYPVKTEKVYLSPDNKYLIGAVAVRNLAFHKLVLARFTLDYWKTTSEVVAEYNNDVRKKLAHNGYDRFTFNIKLEDQANLENKTMFFCIRYNVNGQDYWDNNNNLNYQVDFSKKFKSGQPNPQASRSLGALPRSKPSPTFNNASPSMRPRSMPSFDDFASNMAPYEFSSFPHPSSRTEDSPIRFRSKPSADDIVPDSPAKPKASSNQQAFGNRYDFGASLSAAIQGTGLAPGDKNGPPQRSAPRPTMSAPLVTMQSSPSAGQRVSSSEASKPDLSSGPKPAALTSEKPSLQSPSYTELLDKYCFFGSAKATSPQSKFVPNGIGQTDGQSDDKPKLAAVKPTEEHIEHVRQIKPAASPALPRTTSSNVEERSSSKVPSTSTSRSASPAKAMGSRAASPSTFGYPYHHSMQNGFFDQHTPTAIRG